MRDFIVGIPTLHRYDLLDQCLAAIAQNTETPASVIVVDHGRQWTEPAADRFAFPIELVRPRRNLGVAAAWNLIGKIAYPADLFLVNDDYFVAPNQFEQFLNTPGAVVQDHNCWSCVLIRKLAWEAVGQFDESFWPAYAEDNDYAWRLRCAGLPAGRVIVQGERHEGSATIRSVSAEQEREWRASIDRGLAYYERKWGGRPGEERFLSPFNQ